MIVKQIEYRDELLKELDRYITEHSHIYFTIRQHWTTGVWRRYNNADEIKQTIIELLDNCIADIHEQLREGHKEAAAAIETTGILVKLKYHSCTTEPSFGQFELKFTIHPQ